MGETYGAVSMFVSPVLTNIKRFFCIPAIVFPGLWHPWDMNTLHNYTSSWYLIESFEPHVIWTTLGYFAYPGNSLPVVLQINFWVAKPHIHQHRVPSQCHHCFCQQRVFKQVGYQWKDLKQVRSMCMIQRVRTEAEVTYLQPLRDHVQKTCVCWISRLLYDVLMFGAASLAPYRPWPQQNWIQTKLLNSCGGAIGLDEVGLL